MPPLLISDSGEDADSLWMTGMTASADDKELMFVVAAVAGAVPCFIVAIARWAFLDLDRSLRSSFYGGRREVKPWRQEG